ncbi:MAG: Dabb family protein [Polyangiales bacterium]
MIQRIALFKLKSEFCNEEGRKEVAARTRAVLSALPDVKRVKVGVPSDDESLKSWDVSICVEFDDMEAVERYKVDADHRRHVDEYMMPRVEVRKAWNFEVE